MGNKRISVIVPVYQVEPYLERCVQSICAQTHRNLEIILVDDGSPDGCGALCDALALGDERIVVIHKENGGVSSARNAGLDVATGAYIGFVDSDDWIAPEMYETLLETMEREQVPMAVCGYLVYDERGNLSDTVLPLAGECRRPSSEFLLSLISSIRRETTRELTGFSCCNKLYDRGLWNTVRFDESATIGEDCVAVIEISLTIPFIGVCFSPLYHYCTREGSATSNDFREMISANYQVTYATFLRLKEIPFLRSAFLENFVVITFSYFNALVRKADFPAYRKARRDLLIFWPEIRAHYHCYDTKYRGALFLLRYAPHIFFQLNRWRVLH